MSDNPRLIPVVSASVAVIAIVAVVITLSVIPFPDFPDLRAGQAEGRIAYITWDNCIRVADLAAAETPEIFCGSDRDSIDALAWDESGISFVMWMSGGQTLRTIDPATGDVISTEQLADNEFDRRVAVAIDVWTDRQDGQIVVRTPDGDIVFRATAPDSYWIEYGAQSPTGTWAIVDSEGRLAVLEDTGSGWLVDDNVRSWQSAAWSPTG